MAIVCYSELQMSPTTIQVSETLKRRLLKAKQHPRETYEDVIARALDDQEQLDRWEDEMELSAETRLKIERGRRDHAAGRSIPWEQVKKDLGL